MSSVGGSVIAHGPVPFPFFGMVSNAFTVVKNELGT